MSDRLRLTIAAAVTVLFLAAISVAGITLHTGSPTQTALAPVAIAPAPLTTQAAQPSSVPHWEEEHD